MSRHPASSEAGVRLLLDGAKELPAQPEAVRARVLARARATAAGPLSLVPAPTPHARFTLQVLAPAAAMAVVGVVGTVLALNGGWSRPKATPRTASAANGSLLASAATAAPSSTAPASPAPAPAAVASAPAQPAPDPAQGVTRTAPRGVRHDDAQASYAAELELMRNAHTAYAARDYTNALVLIGEHARRFPNGLLSEEREALRVRCLLGAGRKNQARLAARAFAAHFPRSVELRQSWPRSRVSAGKYAELG